MHPVGIVWYATNNQVHWRRTTKLVESKETEPMRHFGSHIKPAHVPYCQMSDYPYCCGAAILYQFGNEKATFAKDLPVMIARAIKQRKGLLVAIINDCQIRNGLDEVLKKHGFVCQNAASNPYHGDETVVHLYTLNIGNNVVEKGKA